MFSSVTKSHESAEVLHIFSLSENLLNSGSTLSFEKHTYIYIYIIRIFSHLAEMINIQT